MVAEQKVTRASANFDSSMLYHLGLIQMNKKNRRAIDEGCLANPTHPDCQLDNVMVIPGAWEGIDFNRDKFRDQEWILGQPVQKLLEGRLSHDPRQGDYDWIQWTWGPNYPQYYLAGVPGHCRFLDGEKALAPLVKGGNGALVGLFKKAVKHYGGRDI